MSAPTDQPSSYQPPDRPAPTPPPPYQPSPTQQGLRGVRRLFAVLGVGEVVMLLAAVLGTITLLFYLNRALAGSPAVLTPTPPAIGVEATPRAPLRR